ncbi:hypothetical protein L0Z72_01855 [candidate division KSB1 bacterium]|nr:hypothetical protein [candidate division KSB1 bacterium]
MAGRIGGLILIATSLVLISCISKTFLAYDVNSYQDGSVAGSKKFNKFAAISYSSAFSTSVYEQHDGYATDINLKTSAGINGYSISYGMTSSTDIGSNFNWGMSGSLDFISFGGKFFIKQQLLKTASDFNLSVLPCIGYNIGSSLIVGDIDVSSNLTGIELHIPMSFENKKLLTWILNPKFFYFCYRVPIKIEYETTEPEWDEKGFRLVQVEHITRMNIKKELYCPAISFGFSYKEICPELTIIHIDKSLRIFFGTAMKF